MTRKLNRLELDFETTWQYVQDNLNGANTLSEKLSFLIKKKRGFFYTYVTSFLDESRVYEFNYSIDANVINKNELAIRMHEYLRGDEFVACVFEDVLRGPKDNNSISLQQCGLQYEDELYYLLNQTNLTQDLVVRCLYNSSAIWHSLCLLFRSDANHLSFETKIDMDDFDYYCAHVRLAIIGAYDDEGYIFWAPSPNDLKL